MGIETIKKLEQTVVKFLNFDGWKLEWTGDGFKNYDACGFTRKGMPCVIEMNLFSFIHFSIFSSSCN